MDLKQDLRGMREKIGRLRQDPPAFNFAVAAVLLAVSLAGVTMPLGGSLDDKRTALELTRERAAVAERLAGHLAAWQQVAQRIVAQAEAVDWDAYLLQHLRAAGLRVLSQERPDLIELGEFRTLTLRLRAGGSYAQIVDFLDRVEQGERLMRVERLLITIGQSELELELELVGLAGRLPVEWSPIESGGDA